MKLGKIGLVKALPERIEQRNNFLRQSQWHEWDILTEIGDASARKYYRLGKGNRSVILMDADPRICGSSSDFIGIAAILRSANISAPEVYKYDLIQGFLIIEDLGTHTYANWIMHKPSEEVQLFLHANKVIETAQTIQTDLSLKILTPEYAAAITTPFWDNYAPEQKEEGISILKEALDLVDTNKPVFCFRDFHAENLIWRATHSGLSKTGVLDFQDAHLAHPIYDIVSILRDARRDINPVTFKHVSMLWNDKGFDFDTTFSVYSVQRNLRILGIFCNLIERQNKQKYRAYLSRVAGYLHQDIQHPVLSDLNKLIGSKIS